MPLRSEHFTPASTGLRLCFGQRLAHQAKRRTVSTNRRTGVESRLRSSLAHRRRRRHSWGMKIGIIGAGAIGGWVAARLALAGNSVSVLARGETLEALLGGLSIREDGATKRAEVRSSPDPAVIGPQDLLIIAVKAPALADVRA